MQTLENNIRLVTVLPLTVVDGDATPILGSAIDTYEDSEGIHSFDSALITAVVGAVGADVSAATITIQEANDSGFATSPTTAEGGEAQSIVAGTVTKIFQIKRTKRYLRAVIAITEAGAADTIQVAITGVLANWAKPFPVV